MDEVVVRLSSKGQLTLPVNIRRQLKLKEGDYLAVSVRGDGVFLSKVETIRSLSDGDPIWGLIGAGQSGHRDVSEDHDLYLAEAEIKRWKQS